jgi:hypothetical protein
VKSSQPDPLAARRNAARMLVRWVMLGGECPPSHPLASHGTSKTKGEIARVRCSPRRSPPTARPHFLFRWPGSRLC